MFVDVKGVTDGACAHTHVHEMCVCYMNSTNLVTLSVFISTTRVLIYVKFKIYYALSVSSGGIRGNV